MSYKILFSNIGYAKGIDGTLHEHLRHFKRHFFCDIPAQKHALDQLRAIIAQEQPDLCCFVEIAHEGDIEGAFNQIDHLIGGEYSHHDVSDKYGQGNWIKKMPLHQGRCNAFLSKREIEFERMYFKHGTKRLIYRMALPDGTNLFFAHFSLMRKTRARQFVELRRLLSRVHGEVIIMADFNIMTGFGELAPLLRDSNLRLLNREGEHTFRFHKRRLTLDLCICSENIADKSRLKVIPQPFSDHDALLLEVD